MLRDEHATSKNANDAPTLQNDEWRKELRKMSLLAVE